MAFKRIPNSDITVRPFKVYKDWTFTEQSSEISVDKARNINPSTIDNLATDFINSGSGISEALLYSSLKTLYYPDNHFDGSFLNKLGTVYSGADFRFISTASLSGSNCILVANRYVGEEIKRGSLTVLDLSLPTSTSSTTFIDDGFGNLVDDGDVYTITLYDAETSEMILTNGDGTSVSLTVSGSDFETGSITFTSSTGETTHQFQFLDFDNAIIKFEDDDVPSELTSSRYYVGNIFYQHGIINLTNEAFVDQGYFLGTGSNGITLNYKSTITIRENEILCTVNESEFNISQNPTSYNTSSFEIRNDYTSAFDGVTVGGFLDYDISSSVDPTGSFLAPFITTIGLYDANYNMVVVAKLPQPIKSLPDFPVNFIIRFDT